VSFAIVGIISCGITYINSFRVKMNEKHAIMTPFDITSKMLGPYLFSGTARETLGEKMELYFQDHSFVPLFIQVRTEVELRHEIPIH